MSADSGPGQREVAYRLFSAEFDDATLSYSESDEERAPNYVVTPTGLRVNRLFAVGVLTQVEPVSDDVLRGRVVDPTGAFVTYAGQYQPDAYGFLERTSPPAFLAMTGKARTFEPDDGDSIYTSVRPESLSEVDAETRDRWTVSTAEATLRRVAVFARALERDERGEELRETLQSAGVDEALAAGIPRAIDHYGTTTAYLEGVRQLAVDALEVVAGERDEVRALSRAPDEGGRVEIGPLPSVEAADELATAEEVVPAEPPSDEPEESPSSDEDELGDYAAEAESEAEAGGPTDEMYELDEEEIREVEEEFGTDFSTGTEVDEAGEADIDVPDAEELAEEMGEEEAETEPETETEAAEPEASESEASETEERPEDMSAAAVEIMEELGDDEAVEREAVVAEMVSRYGVSEEEAEDAIQDALMSGLCYEPGETTLRAI